MRWLTSERVGRWTHGAGLVALVALAWGVFGPEDLFWTAIVAAGLIGSAIATAALIRSRSVPTLAEVIASAEVEPVVVPVGGGYRGGAGLRSRGERA